MFELTIYQSMRLLIIIFHFYPQIKRKYVYLYKNNSYASNRI